MASQPEQSTFDVGVYNLELADPVQGGIGGVSNKPLLNLANRTRWLADQLALLANGQVIPTGIAPILSPHFTGSPLAPTPGTGDNSTSLATTAFVQTTSGGQLQLNVAGNTNVSLTAAQAGNAILQFLGVLTGPVSIIVPLVHAKWIIVNSTTGAFPLTIKTASGSGVAVTQGTFSLMWCDAGSVLPQITDYPSISLTGRSTTPTPTAGDNSLTIANTAFCFGFAPKLSPQFTGNASFQIRPAFAGQVPWDTGNFNPATKLTYNARQENTGGLTFSWGGAGNISGITANGQTTPLMIANAGNPAASAVIAFLRDGQYGAFFGLDQDNQWAVGGWSMGSVRYLIWHQGNSANPSDVLNVANNGVAIGNNATNIANAAAANANGRAPIRNGNGVYGYVGSDTGNSIIINWSSGGYNVYVDSQYQGNMVTVNGGVNNVANYATPTSSMAYNGVGSYTFLNNGNNPGVNQLFGNLLGGGGTWRCMSGGFGTQGKDYLYVRIS